MMKKKKQNRFIYRVHYQTNRGSGWRRLITDKKMTPARRGRLEEIFLGALKPELNINELIITNVEWLNKIN